MAPKIQPTARWPVGKPRDPARIERIATKLVAAWTRWPDLRLGQLIVNLTTKRDPFHVEDDVVECRLDTWIDTGELPPAVAAPADPEALPWVEGEPDVTLCEARYAGSYEGGRWLAFPCAPNRVPSRAFADDVKAMDFWLERWPLGGESAESRLIGRGATPDAALADLRRRARAERSRR